MAYRFQPQLGANCQQRAQAQIPICVVTTLDHTQMLFAHVPVGAGGSSWVVQSMSCSVQRFWNASTATLKVTSAAEDANYFAPPLPLIQNPADEIIHPLGPEDNICIWMGYVDNLFIPGQDLVKLMEGETPHLMRVFVGVIDTVGFVGTDAGFTYTLQCRDRMRYLMETQVSLSPFDIVNDRSYMNLALGGTKSEVTRSETILRLAQLGIGHVTLGKDPKDTIDVNGLRIERGIIKDLGKIVSEKITDVAPADAAAETPAKDIEKKAAMPPPDYFYNYDDRPLAAQTKTRQLDLSFNPKFNIVTSRLPFSTESVAKEYTLEQQIPIELIKWLSNQESTPTELFSNPQDGDYYYVPRASDLSGLSDPSRFFRTYYFRYQPPQLADAEYIASLSQQYPALEVKTKFKDTSNNLTVDPTEPFKYLPDYNQGIINWREELTTNAMYTNYIIGNNSPNSTKDGNVILTTLSVRPPFLAGRSMAGRNMYIIDETINNLQEAIAVGNNYARIHSKETRAASMTLIGDPSLIPGELMQIVGSPLHPELITIPSLVAERAGIVEFLQREAGVFENIVDKTKSFAPDQQKGMPVNGANNQTSPANQYVPLPAQIGVALGGNCVSKDAGGTPMLMRSFREVDRGICYFTDKDLNSPLPKAPDVLSESKQGGVPTTSATGAATAPAGQGIVSNASQSQMIYPFATGWKTTSGLGPRNVIGGSRDHKGTDIGAPDGTPVLAALSGKVTVASLQPGGMGKGFGNFIAIDHGNNLHTWYGHLKEIKVTVGQDVTTGQQIALSGGVKGVLGSGASTGPHLHFQLVDNNGAFLIPNYMIFSEGNTPSAAVIAGRLKAAGIAATTAAPAATTPAAVKEQVKPEASSKVKPVNAYRNILVLSRTNVKNSLGLEDLKLELYDKSGNVIFTGTVNSGRANKQEFGTAQNDLSGQEYPMPYGKYTIGGETTGGPAGVGKYFFPITPNFKTGRSALGIHVDADRATAPGTAGCGGITTQTEFDNFRYHFKNSRVVNFIFVKDIASPAASSPVAAADSTGAATVPTTPAVEAAPTEYSFTKYPEYQNEEWKKSHFNQEPQSMFRVDAVRHDFNAVGKALGYSVEVVLLPITG
jgi:murein DD-endopeptidase MepM/ murein hydrolase activator NlpD